MAFVIFRVHAWKIRLSYRHWWEVSGHSPGNSIFTVLVPSLTSHRIIRASGQTDSWQFVECFKRIHCALHCVWSDDILRLLACICNPIQWDLTGAGVPLCLYPYAQPRLKVGREPHEGWMLIGPVSKYRIFIPAPALLDIWWTSGVEQYGSNHNSLRESCKIYIFSQK